MKLKELYKKEVFPKLKDKFGYTNLFQAPRLTKVVVNIGVGRHTKEKAYIEEVAANLAKIVGQKPVLVKAKKSIAAFKIRQGMIVGITATLRGDRMYDFTEKVINISFPRVRDFRGISDKNVDSSGNLTVGLKENTIFPEIRADEIENVYGMEITFVNTAKNREEGLEFYRLMGFPFKKDEK